MDEEKLRSRVNAASKQLADSYAVVAMPKVAVSGAAAHLRALGLRAEVVDDGEDAGGVVAVALLPDSRAFDDLIRLDKRAFRVATFCFLVSAAVVVGGIAAHVPMVAGAWMYFGAHAAWRMLFEHAALTGRRRAQAEMRESGL